MIQRFLVCLYDMTGDTTIHEISENDNLSLDHPHSVVMQEGAWYDSRTDIGWTLVVMAPLEFVLTPLDIHIAENLLVEYLSGGEHK